MPNLDRPAVTGWLASAHPAPPLAAQPPIRAVEEHSAVEKSLAALGRALDTTAGDHLPELSHALRADPIRAEMQAILAQLGAARLLRILHWLAETDLPEGRAVLAELLRDDGDGSGAALRSAVQSLTRRARLAQIFDPDRLARLTAACEAALRGAA
jgi:hypothetical protein